MSGFHSQGSRNPDGFGAYDESKHARSSDGKFGSLRSPELFISTEYIL